MTFKEIVDTVFVASPAEQTEVIAIRQDDNLTRFANNCVHQNVNERNVHIFLRSVVGRRVGIVISNDTRRESLEKLTRRAYELARLSPENPEFKGLPSPKPLPSVSAFDDRTARCSPHDRAVRARVFCDKSRAAGYTAAGSVRTIGWSVGVANSLGVLAETSNSIADVSAVISSVSSSGWTHQSASRLDDLDIEAMADEALDKVQMGENPADFESGEHTVILDPYATADILDSLAYVGMGALSVQEDRSWMNGRIRQKAVAESVTIVDDGLAASGIPLPFDFEGLPKRRVPIIEAGVVMGPVYDTFTAGREPERESTGHATPPSPSEPVGPMPLNLFMRTGSTSVDEMIRSTKLGLYVTRFWYTRVVHPRDCVITGMTRDGTYVVKDGEIAYPAKSLRFTQSYVEALKNVEAIGSVPRLLWSEYLWTTTSVPAIKVGSFRFTSATR